MPPQAPTQHPNRKAEPRFRDSAWRFPNPEAEKLSLRAKIKATRALDWTQSPRRGGLLACGTGGCLKRREGLKPGGSQTGPTFSISL